MCQDSKPKGKLKKDERKETWIGWQKRNIEIKEREDMKTERNGKIRRNYE